MHVEQITVRELYSRPGFNEMVAEYSQYAIKRMPKPLYRMEDYLPMEHAGILTPYCFMVDGKTAGFMSIIKTKIPHYGLTVAIVESLFVMKAHRKKGIGLRLIETAEDFGRIHALCGIFINCPYDHPLAVILRRRNYSAETISFFLPL